MSSYSLPFQSDRHTLHPPVLVTVSSAGAGDSLPVWLLALCGAFTAVGSSCLLLGIVQAAKLRPATGVSVMSITLQLKNYRKPSLQRAVVRIMVMVPLYAISSLIALFSLEAAFFIDAVRDLYEALVIYTFFQLLITYLGGERSLLIILHGRPPIPHPFPVSVFLQPMDVSDPWVLLNLKRGVLQYVQLKPLLVLATVILKATGKYQEGRFASDSGYTYISIVYNTSICLSLYCLAMFWVAVAKDLKPFRPVPKFLCVKGILFFSFWQSTGVSLLVAWHAIKRVGVYTDPEHMSLALVDSLICFEMPIFAIAHQYAFQAKDYIDHSLIHAARLPFIYALRDSFGLKDVWEDIKYTLKGRGVSYQAYEPAEGGLHHGTGRQKRIRAGLRYSKGGKAKYWVPIPGDEARNRGETGPISAFKRRVDERLATREGYAPLLPKQASKVVRDDPEGLDEGNNVEWTGIFDDSDSDESDAPSLGFQSVEEDEDHMYERARRIGYAGFPNVDVSREEARRRLWEEEEGILAGKWNRGGRRQEGKPKVGKEGRRSNGAGNGKGKENGDAKGRVGVYGAWADRVSKIDRDNKKHSTSNGHSPHRPINPTGEGDWLFDGERPDAWHNSEADAARLRWTKKQLLKSPREPVEIDERPTSPFTLGDDPDEPNEPDPEQAVSPSDRRLPSDAVDLVKEDPQVVEEAQTRSRLSGEPQSRAPVHVYHHDPEYVSGEDDEVEEVYETAFPEERRTSESVDQGGAPGGDPIEQLEIIKEQVSAQTPSVDKQRGHTSPFDENNPWA